MTVGIGGRAARISTIRSIWTRRRRRSSPRRTAQTRTSPAPSRGAFRFRRATFRASSARRHTHIPAKSADLRRIAIRSALPHLADGPDFLGPAGSFRFFRWLSGHVDPEPWMTDPGRGSALGRHAFDAPISAVGFLSHDPPAVERAQRCFVQGHSTVCKAYADVPHRTFATDASGFAPIAAFAGSLRADRVPIRPDVNLLHSSDRLPVLSDIRQRTAGRFLRALRLSPGQSALWMGEALKASSTEDGALDAALIEMQMRRAEVAELFEACRSSYPAYCIGRPGAGPSIMLGFGPNDPPVLPAIDQPDDGAILQETARRRNLLRQGQRAQDVFAR
jgi:hypothetical protein